MTSLALVVLAAATLAAAPLDAQTRPDFSGTWSLDRERSESPHQTGTFEPTVVVITQSGTEVAIETRRGTATSRAVYPLSAEAAPAAPTAPNSPASGASRAFWDGASLVTEGVRTVQGQTVSVRETRALEPGGREMTVKTLLVVQHGYTLRGAQNYGAATDLYVRAPQ